MKLSKNSITLENVRKAFFHVERMRLPDKLYCTCASVEAMQEDVPDMVRELFSKIRGRKKLAGKAKEILPISS